MGGGEDGSYIAVSLADGRVEDEVRRGEDIHQGHGLVFELETRGRSREEALNVCVRDTTFQC